MRPPTKALARAKINLALHVTGQDRRGYHLLDSIVGFAAIGDWVYFHPGARLSLDIGGPFGAGLDAGTDNLIWRAAELVGGTGSFRLDKCLPVASGIGGGSADAAAALNLLSPTFGQPGVDAALSLGADIPVCLAGEPVRMGGIGGDLHKITLPSFAMVLVNPGLSVSTKDVFNALKKKDNPALTGHPDTPDHTAWLDWLHAQRNDLAGPAIGLAPAIETCLIALRETGADLVRMSGSGATCFGLFRAQANAISAAREIARRHSNWWVKATRLMGSEDPFDHVIRDTFEM